MFHEGIIGAKVHIDHLYKFCVESSVWRSTNSPLVTLLVQALTTCKLQSDSQITIYAEIFAVCIFHSLAIDQDFRI